MYLEPDNRITFTLRIMKLEESDFGAYTCTASNRHGHTSGTTTVGRTYIFLAYDWIGLIDIRP